MLAADQPTLSAAAGYISQKPLRSTTPPDPPTSAADSCCLDLSVRPGPQDAQARLGRQYWPSLKARNTTRHWTEKTCAGQALAGFFLTGTTFS